MAPALEGLTVLDLTQVMAGPFCAMLLCDMGADVIKIEPPGGDSTRRMAGAADGDSASFNAVNRGKRSLVVDLKKPAGRDVVRQLVAGTDVFIENYRPGVMKAFGLDYQALAAAHSALVYASISGYGQTGPYASRGGFDLVAQGVSGIMSVTGEPGRPPVKAGVPLTDLGAGLLALAGILAALFHRDRTGRGQYIDTSLVDAGVALSVWEATEYFSGAGVPQPLGSAHRMSAPYQAIRCSDGYITLGAANDRLFRRLCQVLGREAWADEPSFADDTGRVKHQPALAARIEAITSDQPRRHWLELFERHDIPCGPINNYAEVVSDPHILARGLVVETDHPVLGRIKTLGSPLKLSESPLATGRPAPLLGQHTNQILGAIGFSAADIAELRRGGVVR